MRFITASTLLGNFLSPQLDALVGLPKALRFVEQPLDTVAPVNEFDAYTPGMIVFAILLLIPQTAMVLARELRWGTLQRLRLTLVRARDLWVGVSLAEMVLALGQVVLMFAAALALGFHNRGSLLNAVVVGLGLSFSAIGFGLMVACFSDNDSDALNIGSTVTMLQVFMSGAFFALPPLTVFTLAGHEIGLFDFLPATHGILALQQVLVGGAGLEEIWFRMVAMVGLSLVYFAAGVVIFAQMQMRQGVGGIQLPVRAG
jgi:ABC-2 type transport system permease protein